MNIAQNIIETIRPLSIAACTLQGGYAQAYDGKRVTFAPYVKELATRRNKNGRVLLLLCEYSDGSRIRFTWSDYDGPKYRDATPKAQA